MTSSVYEASGLDGLEHLERARGAREAGPNVGALLSGVVAVAVVGTAFAVAVGLRVGELRHHPIVERYGTVATVVVTPSETPRSLDGGRMMSI